MSQKDLLQKIGFLPKENTSGIFHKKYSECDNYAVEIDFEKNVFNFGGKIVFNDSKKSIQNITKPEDWVVLECVNRLLEKGYQPKNIILEKTWKTGHGTSGRLDILVTKDDGTAYLMIECKTWGTEFDKEFKKIEKNGGQLFTYFQQDKNADILVLYASEFDGDAVNYRNEIIKIEEDYRQTANVKDFHERWNKLPKSNGVFDDWVTPYEFKSKALTIKNLKVLQQEDSSFIFNRFLEILRHNVVSDKPNAFNKIFTLFLCKIIDEDRNPDDQLHFQWLEGEDDHISFQKRLTDLYNLGMRELLEKKVTDVSDSEFDKRFQQVEDKHREAFKEILTEIRLKKNNEFAIKEVYDDASFEENAKVVKEVVELLQVYKIRYNYRQQFLSDFFELLLTTGLKQESGQFFTPVPIARFIIKSLPFQKITQQKIEQGNKNDLLPVIIDYAAGSGHFLTESMEEVQKFVDDINEKSLTPATRKAIKKWKADQFDWAEKYVYGIEKDYRLVKTAKVSCYLHGDGLAKVIHGDGLGDFETDENFKDSLTETDRTYSQDNKQFDIVISNPPYSVSSFKGTMMNELKANKAFDLYHRLTDQSSEIECLFIERTKQLLKDGGIAGIILPSSILSNTGIYTQTREIILKYFEVFAIAEMGSNTFMATGTNTVTLFLRRRNNADWVNIQAAVTKAFSNQKDVTINGIEKPISKYINHVWEDISLNDYKTLLKKTPNQNIQQQEIYQDYQKKIKAKNDQEKWEAILALEREKLLYFVLTYSQKIVLVKTGQKKEEKQFLGYEFSNRRGSEGIHPIQRGKTIDECTQLYDAEVFDNPEKASTYIYQAFSENRFDLEIPESLKKNISYHNLVDMLTFDRVDFEKNISLAVKKKVRFESKYKQVKLWNLTTLMKRGKSAKYGNSKIQIIKSGQARGFYTFDFKEKYFVNEDFILDERKLQKGDLLLNSSGVGTAGRVTFFDLENDCVADSHITILRFDKNLVIPKYALNIFGAIGFKNLESLALGQSGQIEMTIDTISNFKIPLPPKEIQEKIVSEIKLLEKEEENCNAYIQKLKEDISKVLNTNSIEGKISDLCDISSSKINPQDFPNKDFYYLGLEHIKSNNGSILAKNVEKGKNIFSVKNHFKKGDVLYGKLRPYLNKVAMPDFEGICSTDILVLKSPHPTLLKNILLSEKVVAQTSLLMKGVSLPRIKKGTLLNLKVQIPTTKTQQKIVTQIEKIEAKIKTLEAQIELIPQQKELILKKYLA